MTEGRGSFGLGWRGSAMPFDSENRAHPRRLSLVGGRPIVAQRTRFAFDRDRPAHRDPSAPSTRALEIRGPYDPAIRPMIEFEISFPVRRSGRC
jgi:hypothetical protein